MFLLASKSAGEKGFLILALVAFLARSTYFSPSYQGAICQLVQMAFHFILLVLLRTMSRISGLRNDMNKRTLYKQARI